MFTKLKTLLLIPIALALLLVGILANNLAGTATKSINIVSADQNYGLNAEQLEIESVITQMVENFKLVGKDKNTSRFKDFFDDHPKYLNDIAAESALQVVLPADKQIKDKDGKYKATKVGMLTYWTARVDSHFRVTRMLEDAYSKAKKENRDITQEDMKYIADQNNGQIPGTMLLGVDIRLEFQSIEVNGDTATVNYTRNGNQVVTTLIKKGNKWLVVNEMLTPSV